ncbi:MAG: hypothetical protein N2Z67_07730 [Acetobacteraceae bacterium]|nr:hypothetical protein [Acetobacteraceae bacterium]
MRPARPPLSRAAALPMLFGLLALGACGGQGSSIADSAVLASAPRPPMWGGAAVDRSPEELRPWLGPTQSGQCCGPGTGVITVASVPPGATCTVSRDGQRVAELTTPARVELLRGNSPATVSCTAPGHLPTTVTLRPLRDLGVHHHQPIPGRGAQEHRRDIETGRVRRFFDVTVHLPPARFASAAERDAWFSARAAEIRAYWAEPIARAERAAAARYNGMIDSPETLRGYMQADLAALEAQRAATQAGPATAARGR